jgi:hypothetical protein
MIGDSNISLESRLQNGGHGGFHSGDCIGLAEDSNNNPYLF